MPLPSTAALPALPALALPTPPITAKEPVRPKGYNRIRAILVHAPWYSIDGQARLAADVGVSRSTISRILSGRSMPSVRLAQEITDALESRLNRPLELREVFSPDGTYPTASCCTLCGCHHGCMPEAAYDHRYRLKPEYRDMNPGDWSLSPTSASYTTATATTTNLNNN